MTINLADNTPRVSYAVAEGATQTSFTVSFEFFDAADLNVYVDGVLKTLTTNYTVSGGNGSTGTVTISVTGATGGSTVVITRDIDLKRTTDFPASGAFQINSLNTELDKLIAIAADLDDKASRALQLTDFDAAVSLVLPDVNTRKGKTLAFNASTGAVEAGPSTSDVQTVSATAADIAALADIEDGTIATDAISGLAAIKTNVTTVAGIASNVTSVAGNATNINTVAGDATDIGTVAGISSNITTVAGISSNVTSVAGKATEVGRLGTADAVSDMNTLGTSSNVTNMNTLAAIASDITTTAGVASSISASGTNASNAASSATAAASSATAAASSATAAAASQTAAAASAASAASAFDNFDDTYLGSKTSNPTTDNDGDALTSGDLYFNTTANEMRVYDGANWIAATSAGNVSLILYEYTATAGQTTFSGSDDNSATLSYTVDNLQVVMNGIVLDPSDFTAINGTSVVLASGAATGDLINIYAFKSFTTADMVSKTNGGTFSGAVGFSGGITGDVAFDTNTLKVDSSNNRVGIGTAPDRDLHVKGATGDPVHLKLEGDPADYARIMFDDGTDDNIGEIRYHFGDENMRFTVNAAERFRITADGDVGIGTTSPINNTGFGGLTLNGDNGSIFSLKDSDTEVARVVGSATEMSFQYGTSSVLTFKDGLSGGQERLRLDSSGRLLMGVTGPTNGGESFYVDAFDGFRLFCSRGSTQLREQIVFHNPNGDVGSIDTAGSSTSYNTSSDHRLKENVADMTGAIDRVKQLAPKRFNFIADADTTVDGFLAHEAQAVVPEAVTGTKDEVDDDGNAVMQGIDHGKLVPLLTGALREAIAKIETLEAKVAALEAAE